MDDVSDACREIRTPPVGEQIRTAHVKEGIGTRHVGEEIRALHVTASCRRRSFTCMWWRKLCLLRKQWMMSMRLLRKAETFSVLPLVDATSAILNRFESQKQCAPATSSQRAGDTKKSDCDAKLGTATFCELGGRGRCSWPPLEPPRPHDAGGTTALEPPGPRPIQDRCAAQASPIIAQVAQTSHQNNDSDSFDPELKQI